VAKTTRAKAVAATPAPAATGDYEALRRQLMQQKQEIISMYQQDVRAGQESADDGTEDIVDRANNSYNRELMFSLSDSERQMLLHVEDALRRIDDGAYGRCSNCGQEINMLRLQAVPWTRFCINCQELAEKGLLSEEAS
jgi:DnaK suppressor protein